MKVWNAAQKIGFGGMVILLSLLNFAAVRSQTIQKSAASAAFQQPARKNPPFHFEPNRGQHDASATFAASIGSTKLFLNDRAEISLALGEEKKDDLLKTFFVEANSHPQIVGDDATGGHSNYLNVGRGTAIAAVPHFRRVVARSLYRGIDAVFYGRDGMFEYDFVVQPAADTRQIKIAFDGAESIKIAANGDLHLSLNGRTIIQRKPFAYQIVNGEQKKIASRYVFERGAVKIRVGKYDRRRQLVIDPQIVYSGFLGGTGYDTASEVAVDSQGRAYLSGSTFSNNFPQTDGSVRRGNFDVFVTRFNAAATAVEYSTYIGGTGEDIANGIAVDANFNAYVVGMTASTNFPAVNALYGASAGSNDAFAFKLNAGGAIIYSTYLGSSGFDDAQAVAADAAGNAYVVGTTRLGVGAAVFPTTPGSAQPALTGNSDAFLTKINPTGSALVYSTLNGGEGGELGNGVAVDASGGAYVVGLTTSNVFPTTVGAAQTVFGGMQDVFLTKFNAAGSLRDYSTLYGGAQREYGEAVAIDQTGNALICGYTDPEFPTVNAAQTVYGGGFFDAFALKITPTALTPVSYATYVGGNGQEQCNAVVVSSLGEAHLVGSTFSTNFPVTANALQNTKLGSGDVFITKLTNAGAPTFSTYLGGSNEDSGQGDYPNGAAIDASGRIYVVGFTGAANYPTTNGFYDTIYNSGVDAFLTKIDTSASTAANVSIAGRIFDQNKTPLGRAVILLTDSSGETRRAVSNPFGYYRFDNVPVGSLCLFSIRSKKATFAAQVVTVNENLTELNFFGE